MARAYRDIGLEKALAMYATHDPFSEAIHLARYRFAGQFAGPGVQVYDFGCGPGFGVRHFAELGAQATGIDHFAEAIAHARARHPLPGARFVAADCLEFDAPRESADLITAFELVEHLEAPERFLARCRAWLRPGGRLVLSTPNRLVHALMGIVWEYHVREYGYSELDALLRQVFPDGEIEILGQNPEMIVHFRAQAGRFKPHATPLRRVAARVVPCPVIRALRKAFPRRPAPLNADDPIVREALEISARNVDLCDTFIAAVRIPDEPAAFEGSGP